MCLPYLCFCVCVHACVCIHVYACVYMHMYTCTHSKSLALCLQVASQTPQHFRSYKMQASCDGCFAHQSICSVTFVDSGMSKAVHLNEFLKVDVEHWYMHSRLPTLFFIFCSKLIESVRMMAGVVWLSLLEAIKRRAWVTASISIVNLEVEFVYYAALSSWMVVQPWLILKPHPDWFLVAEPSMYTIRSCGLLFLWMRSLISDSILLVGYSQHCFQVFWHMCLKEMLESVWVPFHFLGLLELCQLAYLQYGVLCLTQQRLVQSHPFMEWVVSFFYGTEVCFLSGLHWWEV